MAKLFRTFALVLAALFALSLIVGCGGDDPDEEEVAAAEFSSAAPASGSEIAANTNITLTFSSDPGEVTVAGATVTGGGKTRQVAGPFAEGALTLAVSWTNGDGSTSLNYTVKAADNTAPTVTGGTVEDGEEDVDPEKINTDGVIEVTFSEEVSGNIALQTEAGDNVGWIGKVEGMKGTLDIVKGKEIGNETTYVIAGKVADAAGNETEVSVTFTTKGKE
ncbi:MAG: Ig-like domain-containing protein [Candidatus Poribacteria bacterium]|nr:Ig-like domain-containing protein [Candidatus Poribacteria bacterium]